MENLEKNDAQEDIASEITRSIVSQAVPLVTAEVVKKYTLNKSIPAVPVNKHDDWSIGEFICKVGQTRQTCSNEVRESAYNVLTNKYYDKKAANMGTGSAGGFGVPEIWREYFLTLPNFDQVFYGSVKKVDLKGMSELILPVLDISGVPGSTSTNPLLAGMATQIISEGANITPTTQPIWRQITVPFVKFASLVPVTAELIDNSIYDVGEVIVNLLRETMVSRYEYSIPNGESGGFTGLIGHASTVLQPRQTHNKFTWQDSYNMSQKILPQCRNKAVWVFHPYHFADLVSMADANNNAIWLSNFRQTVNEPGTINGGTNLTLYGRPVYFSPYLPAIGSSGDVLLVDLTQGYISGVNKDITIVASSDYQFNLNLVNYRLVFRGGGTPRLNGLVTLPDGTSTMSTCVALSSLTS